MSIKPASLLLRCFSEREQDGAWFAMCLELNLYARGDSYLDVRSSLEQVIKEYIREALTSDAEYAEGLLDRPAPLYFWLRYYWLRFRIHVHLLKNFHVKLFTEVLPLQPV
jgi:predicted RNase H-like HicB family nuclease